MTEETKLILEILEAKAIEAALNYGKEQKISKGEYPSAEEILKTKEKIFEGFLRDLIKTIIWEEGKWKKIAK